MEAKRTGSISTTCKDLLHSNTHPVNQHGTLASGEVFPAVGFQGLGASGVSRVTAGGPGKMRPMRARRTPAMDLGMRAEEEAVKSSS